MTHKIFTVLLIFVPIILSNTIEDTTDIPWPLNNPKFDLINEATKEKLFNNRFYDKIFTYIRNSPMYKNSTITDIIDQIIEFETWEAPTRLQNAFPYYLAGYDAEDRPVWIAEIGKYDIRSEVERGEENIQNVIKLAVQAFHRIIKSIFEMDNPPEREVRFATFLLDFEGFDIFQISHPGTVALILQLTRDYKEIIQEILGQCIIVNVNHVAEIAINLVRPILGRLLERVELHGTNRAKWIPHVRRIFPDNAIPKWYGGNPGFKPIQIYG